MHFSSSASSIGLQAGFLPEQCDAGAQLKLSPWCGNVSQKQSHCIWLQSSAVGQHHLSWLSLAEQVHHLIAQLALLTHCSGEAILQQQQGSATPSCNPLSSRHLSKHKTVQLNKAMHAWTYCKLERQACILISCSVKERSRCACRLRLGVNIQSYLDTVR